MLMRKLGWMAGLLLGTVLVMGSVGCGDESSAGDRSANVTAPATGDGGAFSPQDMPMPLLARLDRKLDLTDRQRSAVRDILQSERQELLKSGVIGQGPDKVHEWMQARREKVGDQIAALLTPDQKTQFDQMRQRMRDMTKDGVGHGQVLAKMLDLTDAQKVQVSALFDKKREAMKGVRDSIRSGQMTRAQARDLMRAERDKFHADLEQILTPEQKAKLADMIHEWGGPRRKI